MNTKPFFFDQKGQDYGSTARFTQLAVHQYIGALKVLPDESTRWFKELLNRLLLLVFCFYPHLLYAFFL